MQMQRSDLARKDRRAHRIRFTSLPHHYAFSSSDASLVLSARYIRVRSNVEHSRSGRIGCGFTVSGPEFQIAVDRSLSPGLVACLARCAKFHVQEEKKVA